MNARALELIKNPQLLQAEDLGLLSKEIQKTPYAQSLRALYLLGVSRFDSENYQQTLATTAAYTTDKKILYHLINGESYAVQTAKDTENRESEETSHSSGTQSENVGHQHIPEQTDSGFVQHIITETPLPKPVYVNGELNRILFEGEEEFMNQDAGTIDLEASQESGTLVVESAGKRGEQTKESLPVATETQKSETVEPVEIAPMHVQPEELTADDLSTEIVIAAGEDTPVSETITSDLQETPAEPEVQKEIAGEDQPADRSNSPETPTEHPDQPIGESEALNLHDTASFLPEVKLQPAATAPLKAAPQSAKANKHEEEMKRLLEEVERKIQENKKNRQPKAPETDAEPHTDAGISFAETQKFLAAEPVTKVAEEKREEQIQEEKTAASEEIKEHTAVQTPVVIQHTAETGTEMPSASSSWKPMNFNAGTPDALIGKVPDAPVTKTPESEPAEITTHLEAVELPEAAVSLSADPEIPAKEDAGPEISTANKANIEQDSNVPQFINTWQNWLKIDRSAKQKTEEQPKEKAKAEIIEKFIETAPKISQLKEETSYVVKEKKDDISHLMTETLANIYLEQKLYAKAVEAFQILAKKHPEKKAYFRDRIKEVNQLRSKI